MPQVKRTSLLVALVACALLLGCRADPTAEEKVISRERFIEAQVALRQVDRHLPEADSLRAEVLSAHGITEEDLRTFVNHRSDRPAELATVYDEIRQQLRQIREAQRQQLQAGQGQDADEAEPDEPEFAPEGDALRLRIPTPGAPPPAQRI